MEGKLLDGIRKTIRYTACTSTTKKCGIVLTFMITLR